MECSISFTFLIISSGPTVIFPSFSHSQAAANEPNILANKTDLVENKVSDEYASKASPAPPASIIFLEKLGKANPLGLLLPYEKIPLSPSFKIKFLLFAFSVSRLLIALMLPS